MTRFLYSRAALAIVPTLALSAVLLIGCTTKTEEASAPAPPGGPGATAAPGTPGAPPGMPGAPAGMPGAPGGDAGDPSAAAAAAHPDLAKKVTDLEAKLAQSTDDAATKKALAAAAYDYGHTVMLDDALAPRVKYRAALKQFRRVLELDPGHAKAKEELGTIEAIYKQMGRPVPE